MNERAADQKMIDGLLREIRKYSNLVDQIFDPGSGQLFDLMCSKRYDLAICSVGNCLSYGTNVVRFHGSRARNMMAGWMKLDTPVIFIAHAHPLIHKGYEASMDTIINTYGNVDYTPVRLLEGITGLKPLNREVLVHE